MSQQIVSQTPELDESTLSQVVSRVNLIVSLVSAKPERMSAIYGRSLPDSFAELDQDGSWRKTSQGYSQVTMDGSLEEFSETWPTQGILSDGRCIALPPLEPTTKEDARLLWPTPVATDYKGASTLARLERTGRTDRNNLRDYCRVHFGVTYPPVKLVEWMMGYTEEWTDSRPLEMP